MLRPMRIWHQSMTELDHNPAYRAALQSHVDRVAGPGTEVVLHGLAPGTYGAAPADVLRYPVLYHRILGQVLPLFERAESEGFDAVAIGSYSEPFLREARSMLDIPVTSMAESTLLTGASIARRSGLVTISAEIAWMARDIVSANRLEDRVAGVWTIVPAINEAQLGRAFAEPAQTLAAFTAAARTAIEAGSDVIIPAEGVLNELVVAHGLTEIDGVCVMDAVGVVIAHAQMLATLAARTGLHAGRRWHYPKPPAGVLAQLAEGGPAAATSSKSS